MSGRNWGYNQGSISSSIQNKLSQINIGRGNPYEKRFCSFCEIAQSDPYRQVLFEDEKCVIFNDRNKRPTIGEHFLVIPKKHVKNINTADQKVVQNLKNAGLDYLSGHQVFQVILITFDLYPSF